MIACQRKYDNAESDRSRVMQEFRIRHVDGSYRWFKMTVTAVNEKVNRAGDAGKGFAVVADEVGKLAVSCNDISEHISHSLNQMQQAIEHILSKIEGMDSAVVSQSADMDKINAMIQELNVLCDREKKIAHTVFS